MKAKIKTDCSNWYINIDNKYYNIDSFFGFELFYGISDGIEVIFHSKYRPEDDLRIDLDSDNIDDAKKEFEDFMAFADGKL